MSLLDRVVRRFLSAGDLVNFPGAEAKVRNLHFIKIKGVKYFLSDDGGPLGTPDDHAEWAGNARIIMGPGSGKFKYLWVLDTDRKMVVMWRAHDGNEKVWERASNMASKIVKLDRRSQINRVSHEEFLVISRAMQHAAHENESALKQYIKDNESDMQKLVNQLTQQYFDEQVAPDIERAIEAVESGAVPFGYKPFGEPENQQRHMMTSAMGAIMSKKFTVQAVEKYLSTKGVDLESPGVDIQAAEWAVNDVTYAAYDKYLPARVESEE